MQDPIRKFTGREKYKRPLWATDALDGPSAVRIPFDTSYKYYIGFSLFFCYFTLLFTFTFTFSFFYTSFEGLEGVGYSFEDA